MKFFQYASIAALAAGMAFAQTPAPATGGDQAQNPAHHSAQGHMRRPFVARMAQQLNLTDSQKQQAKTIFEQARQTAKPVADQLRQNREALAAAVKTGDNAKIQQLSDTQGRLMGQMIAIRTEAMAKFYAGLTPDQRAKADQLHQQMKERFQQHSAARHNG